MRFQVMWKKTHLPPEAYRPFFETDSIDEAKDFAMRLASTRPITSTCRIPGGMRSSGISTPRCTGTDPPYPSVCPVLSVRTGLFICV